jgi:hypothetical protein
MQAFPSPIARYCTRDTKTFVDLQRLRHACYNLFQACLLRACLIWKRADAVRSLTCWKVMVQFPVKEGRMRLQRIRPFSFGECFAYRSPFFWRLPVCRPLPQREAVPMAARMLPVPPAASAAPAPSAAIPDPRQRRNAPVANGTPTARSNATLRPGGRSSSSTHAQQPGRRRRAPAPATWWTTSWP